MPVWDYKHTHNSDSFFTASCGKGSTIIFALGHTHQDDTEEDDNHSDENNNNVSPVISLLDNGEIVLELKDNNWDSIKKVKAWTLKECIEMVTSDLTNMGADLHWNYDCWQDSDYLPIALIKQFIKALDLASWKHRDQKDKAGKAYFGHIARVAKKCKTTPAKIVALLHDVIEGTDVTSEMMEDMEFSEFIIKAVICLTQREGVSYEDNVKRAARNPISREVKMADLEDNINLGRLTDVSEENLSRLKKYKDAWDYLRDYPGITSETTLVID